MNRAAWSAFAAFALAAAPLFAQAPPNVEFVRALRDKKLPDLAAEYAAKLLQSGKVPADQAPYLQLELAGASLDIADAEPELNKKPGKYAAARAEIDNFLKKYSEHPLLPRARQERARVASLHGRTQLIIAMRQEGPGRMAEALKARSLLEDAGRQLDAVSNQAKGILEEKFKDEPKTPQEKTLKRELEEAYQRSVLDMAINFMDQTRTYIQDDRASLDKVTELVKKAQPLFESVGKLVTDDPKNRAAWVARAWQGFLYRELGEPKVARRKLKDLEEERQPEAEEGKRFARYFHMRVLNTDAAAVLDVKENAVKVMQTLAEDWLKRYRAFATTPEGCHVRYMLAESLLQESAELKQQAAQQALWTRALALYKEIEQTENDYTERARRQKVAIIFTKQGGDKPRAEPGKLPTFDDCFVRAQFEFLEMEKAVKKINGTITEANVKEKEQELKTTRDAHYSRIKAALIRGLDLAKVELAKGKNSKIIPSEVRDAQVLLSYACIISGDNEKAAEYGEAVALTRPPSSQGSRGALLALNAYGSLAAAAMGEAAEPKLKKLQQLAEYVEKTWPVDPAGYKASHQLALMQLKEGDEKLPEAIARLRRIKPEYPEFISSQFELGRALMHQHEMNARKAGSPAYSPEALAALEAVPDLPPGADPYLAFSFVQARLRLGQLLYQAKRFKQLEELAKPMATRVATLPVEEEKKAEYAQGFATLAVYGTYGQIDQVFTAGDYKKALELLAPVLTEIKEGKFPESGARLRMPMLSLALRGNVQLNQIDKAMDVLKVIQEASKEDEQAGLDVLFALVGQMRNQVQDLRKKGPKAKEELDKVLGNFTKFLEAIGKQANLGNDQLVFLAQSYTGLDKFDEAVKLLDRVKPPANKDDQKEQGKYRLTRVLKIRTLRQSKQLDKAEAVVKECEAEPWAKSNFGLLKEKYLLKMAREDYVTASTEWAKLLQALDKRKDQDPNAKELYWEVYFYQTECIYRQGLRHPDPMKKQEGVNRAAKVIVTLEGRQPDMGSEASKKRFMDLLEAEKPLKTAYDALKAQAAK